MLNFYFVPIPGMTLTFPGAIMGGGTWLTDIIIGDIEEDWISEFL